MTWWRRILQPSARFILAIAVAGPVCPGVLAQAPDVPIYKQGRKESEQEDKISAAAKELYRGGRAANLEEIKEQLKRNSCRLSLPEVANKKLSPREICINARRSHLRVGWCYLCGKCDQWHVNLAGGYTITANGAVATCYHVVQPGKEVKEGCLVAADEDGRVFAVKEVLAANRYADACIVVIDAKDFVPLPLNTNVYPGDIAYCFSDPQDHRGYFSHGVVNRFYQFPGRRPVSAAPSAAYAPTRLNVSTDWAPGSSGSAVLDEFGNAIGHVSTISVIEDEESTEADKPNASGPTMIVFHEAVSAKDVLRLINTPE
ncbi:MAG TPA: serine protease [Verrucomicrobiae bacterium]